METVQDLAVSTARASSSKRSRTHFLHLFVGLAAAIFLFLAGGTGAILAFREPIDLYLNRNLTQITPQGQSIRLNQLVNQTAAKYPGYEPTQLNLPEAPDRELDLILAPARGKPLALAINPYTGEVLGDLDQANQFVEHVLRLHKSLLLGGGDAGAKLSGFALILLAISGVALWNRRKTLRVMPGSPRLSLTLDLHSAVGIYAVAFLFVFAFTGVFPRGIGMKFPPRFEEPAHAPNATLLGAEELIAAAQRLVPGATPVWLNLRWQKAHGGTLVAFRYSYDHTEAGRTLVHINPWSGDVLHVMSTEQMSSFQRFALLRDMEIHTGTILGWPTRVIACISGLVLPIMAVTGPMVWWMRRKRRPQ